MKRIRRELRSQWLGATFGALAVLIALGGPAQAMDSAANVSASIKSALKIAKRADKRSKQALSVAQNASAKTGEQGIAGPQGPQGPAGPSTGPAGGDLAGNYPDPDIASGAVGTNQVADNTIGTLDITDGTLTGADIADRGLDAEDIGLNLSVSIDLPSVPAGSCVAQGLVLNGSELGEMIFVVPEDGALPTGLISQPTVRDPAPLPDAMWQVCNYAAAPIDAPSETFRIMSISP